ncbi:MAG: hypothetical protein Q4Q62_03535 [Thermoplasmata archaeon]|nr:hypothetical protein [Thermoplasmata archaeon]
MKTGDKAIMALAVAVILASSAVYILQMPEKEPDDVTVGDLTYSGSLAAGGVSGTCVSGSAILTYGNGGTSTQWYVKDLSATAFVQSGTVYTERGYELSSSGTTLTVVTPGYYAVRISDGSTTVEGNIVLDGTVTRSYSWSQTVGWTTYSYSFDFTYDFSSYLEYSQADAVRHTTSTLKDSRFAVVDSDMERLEDLLAAEYLEVRGSAASTDQSYADFLLSFVQCCIDYPTAIAKGADGYYRESDSGNGDTYLYGQSEYWAYPMETINMGEGDCEDTSFLLAALYSAAGYTAGVAVLPGHMVALVGLDSFTQTSVYGYTYTAMTITATGEYIYFCETTTSRFVPVGYLTYDVHQDVMELDEVSLVG